MATSNIQLIDGDGMATGVAVVSYGGVGDGVAIVSAEEDEGLDRAGTLTFSADGCADIERGVSQEGLREEYTDRDFLVADGGTFHVLKPEYGDVNYYQFISGVEASVVVIDGLSIVVAAGEMMQGSFADDVGITTNNLTDVVIVGNVSLALSSSGGSNATMQRVSLTYREGYSRNMQYFFYGCTALREVVLRGCSITELRLTFSGCTALETVDMVAVDMSQCTNFNGAFYNCSALAALDGHASWDVGNVTTFNNLFYGCSSMAAFDVSGWDTRNVTLMGGCFRECSALTALDLSGWDTSKNTSFQGMFYNDISLESIAFGDKWDAVAVTDMGSMFSLCSSLTTLTGSIRNIKVNLSASLSPLTRDSALVLINGLYDYAAEGATGGTLTLSNATKALLTDDDRQIATDKGWTIA